ncbi:mdlB, partial [Symbiodinium microadriaticum]
EYSKMTQQAVAKLQDDPELKDFFEDIKKNGMDAMKKYEKDERILAKFSQATG